MVKNYGIISKHQIIDGKCYNEHGQRDVLLGMAIAGTSLAEAPLLVNGNWTKSMTEDYDISGPFSGPDLSEDLKEFKRIIARNCRNKK